MTWNAIWRRLTRRQIEVRSVFPGSVLKVKFWHGEDGYIVAECPQLPGCMSQGKTKEQAARNIRDAIESVLIVRMGQFTPEAPSDERDESDSAGEETFRVKGPELTSV